MNRREVIQLAGGTLASAVLPQGSVATPPQPAKNHHRHPNLLFLFTDQQRQDTLAVYGNTQLKVPNLNRLAAQSTVFHRCYTTQPICTPARGSLQTGLWPHTHGDITNNIALPESTPTMVEMLRAHDYYTAYFGKWHLGNEIFRQHGFDEFESTEDIYGTYYDKSKVGTEGRTHSGYYRFLLEHGQKPDSDGEFSRRFANDLPEELSKPAYLARVAEDFLSRKASQPWVMYVNFLDPHTPFTSAYDKMYDPAVMSVPNSYSNQPDNRELSRNKAIRARIEHGEPGYEGIMADEQAVKEAKARYWGKISLVDKAVGQILDRLNELHLMDDTIIVFTTDHGEMMGDHRLMFKSVMYEEAAKVPMLLKLPRQHSLVHIETPVSHIDVVPTLLDLLGEPVPPHLQGRSWMPYLSSNLPLPDESVVVEWNGQPWPFEEGQNDEPLRALLTRDGWKLVLARDGAGELYQLKTDPRELNNVFYRESSLPIIRRMAAELKLWQKSTGDAPLLFDEERWRDRRNNLGREADL